MSRSVSEYSGPRASERGGSVREAPTRSDIRRDIARGGNEADGPAPPEDRRERILGHTPDGFSLIEVLVALLIASLAAGALANSTRASLRGAAAAESREIASRTAVQALEDLLATPPEELTPLDEEDTVGAVGERVARRRVISPGPIPGTWRLDVSARALRDGASARLATLRRALWIRP